MYIHTARSAIVHLTFIPVLCYNIYMKQVHIIDTVDDIVMIAEFRDDHYNEMVRRGWISYNNWLKDTPIEVMQSKHLVLFLQETSI